MQLTAETLRVPPAADADCYESMTRVLSIKEMIQTGSIWGLEAGSAEHEVSKMINLQDVPLDESGIRQFDIGAVNFIYVLDRRDNTMRLLVARVNIQSPPNLLDTWVLKEHLSAPVFEKVCKSASIPISQSHRHDETGICDFEFSGGVFVNFNTRRNGRGNKGLEGVMLAWDGGSHNKLLQYVPAASGLHPTGFAGG